MTAFVDRVREGAVPLDVGARNSGQDPAEVQNNERIAPADGIAAVLRYAPTLH